MMRSHRSLLAALVAATAVVGPAAAAAAVPILDGDPVTTERVNAGTPSTAAILLSQARFADDGADYVVLSRDDAWPDSLAGSPLTDRGPMLLTPKGQLSPGARAEIDRVLPPGAPVYLLGGTAALSTAVQHQLVADGYTAKRLAGADRVRTALVIADEVRRLRPTAAPWVTVARGYSPASNPTAGWADAVAGGGWAAQTGVPIVLTDQRALHGSVDAWIDARGITKTVLLGGTAALSDAVARAVPNPQRVGGPDRAATAAEISKQLWKAPTSGDRRHFTIIDGWRGDGWAYGLPAAGLAEDTDSPLLMVNGGQVPALTLSLASSPCGPAQVDLAVMGNTRVVSSDAVARLDRADGKTCPAPPPEGQDSEPAPPPTSSPRCDRSYPDFCIPPPPPDLDCDDIGRNNFRVREPDPHRLDGDNDGIGCEA